MTRAQQVMQWKQGERPLAQAIGRRHYNEKRAREKQIRRDTLAALVEKTGPKLFLRRGWAKCLREAFGVSHRTRFIDRFVFALVDSTTHSLSHRDSARSTFCDDKILGKFLSFFI